MRLGSLLVVAGLLWLAACSQSTAPTGDGDAGVPDADGGSDACRAINDLYHSLCGMDLPAEPDCCNAVWPRTLDLDQLLDCSLAVEQCGELIMCGIDASHCDIFECPATEICCPGVFGWSDEIGVVWPCSSVSIGTHGECHDVRICYLGECVPEEAIIDVVCP